MSKKCAVCGQKTENGYCNWCGHQSDEDHESFSSAPPQYSHSHTDASNETLYNTPKTAPTQKKLSGIVFSILAIIIVAIIVIILMQDSVPPFSTSIFDDARKDRYYEHASYQLAETGDSFEETFENGVYMVGYDLPEGIYSLTVTEGDGAIRVTHPAESIYFSESLSKEKTSYSVDTVKELHLYQNSKIQLNDVSIKLQSTSAQTNKLNELPSNTATAEYAFRVEYIAGKDFDAGVYDIVPVGTDGSVTIEHTTDSYVSLDWYDSSSPYKNIDIPEGAILTIRDINVKLVPSSHGAITTSPIDEIEDDLFVY